MPHARTAAPPTRGDARAPAPASAERGFGARAEAAAGDAGHDFARIAVSPPDGPGERLPHGVRRPMEGAFGADFSGVRVHRDGRAAALGARALAWGRHLFFAPGRYDPASPSGRALIGHELAHVVQQRAGRAARPEGAVVDPAPALEGEARAAGARAARGEPAGVWSAGSGAAAAPAPVQGDFFFRTRAGNVRPRRGDPDPGTHQQVGEHQGQPLWAAADDGYSDTEGSDSDDEAAYAPDEEARRRNAEVEKRLKRNLLRERVSGARAEAPEDRQRAMFGGTAFGDPKPRPNKARLHRKEAAFNHPGDVAAERSVISPGPTEHEDADLAELNARLNAPPEARQAIGDAVQGLTHGSRFMVAQYRGLHYGTNKFEAGLRRTHRGLDERNRPIYSQSALRQGRLGPGGYYGLYNDPARAGELGDYQQELTAHAGGIRATLQSLREKPATPEARSAVPRSTARFLPRSLADVSTHLYSEDYEGYHTGLRDARQRAEADDEEPKPPLDAIYEGLPNDENPIVSTGDVPYHAQRYAYGLKPYAGHENETLEPAYDERGRPRRPYAGKTYTSLHPLTDYAPDTGPRQLVPLQNEHRINISQMIIPERESQFEGFMEPDRVVAQHKAKFPSFAKPYKPVYAQKYGLDEGTFQEFGDTFRHPGLGEDERTFAESLLSTHLAKHGEIRAVEEARQMAAQRGARLVYRTGPSSFGFHPPAINVERAPRGRAAASSSSMGGGEAPKKKNRAEKRPVTTRVTGGSSKAPRKKARAQARDVDEDDDAPPRAQPTRMRLRPRKAAVPMLDREESESGSEADDESEQRTDSDEEWSE